MQSDTAHSGDHPHLQDGTAAIHPVTDAMMDHAAREAAALADGIAHHTIVPEHPTAAEAPASGEDAPIDAAPTDAAQAVMGLVAETMGDARHETVETAAAVMDEASGTAERFAAEASHDVERAAEKVRDGLSVSADALSAYNTKVFEMMRANMASTTALFAALVQAKSVPEALSLNADHMHRQMEALTAQGRELAALAQRMALDALQPLQNKTGR